MFYQTHVNTNSEGVYKDNTKAKDNPNRYDTVVATDFWALNKQVLNYFSHADYFLMQNIQTSLLSSILLMCMLLSVLVTTSSNVIFGSSLFLIKKQMRPDSIYWRTLLGAPEKEQAVSTPVLPRAH